MYTHACSLLLGHSLLRVQPSAWPRSTNNITNNDANNNDASSNSNSNSTSNSNSNSNSNSTHSSSNDTDTTHNSNNNFWTLAEDAPFPVEEADRRDISETENFANKKQQLPEALVQHGYYTFYLI